jgi:hypothetical protein
VWDNKESKRIDNCVVDLHARKVANAMKSCVMSKSAGSMVEWAGSIA